MSFASTDIISNNQLKDETQGQESPSFQDTILDKASHDDAKDDVKIGGPTSGITKQEPTSSQLSQNTVPNVASWKEWQNTPVTEAI